METQGQQRRIWRLLLASLALIRVAAAQNTVIDFESFEGISFLGGTPVAEASRLSNQLQDAYGVSFSSAQPWVAVVNLGPGHATSGNNGIGAANADNLLDYSLPIQTSFTYPLHPEIPATTDFISVRADLLGGGPPNTLSVYDLAGNFIAADVEPDNGGTALSVSRPNIHQAVIRGNGTSAFDDLTFGNLTASKEIIDFEGLQGGDFVAGTAIPVETRLTDQFANRGVLFSSTAGYAAILNLGAGHAYGGTNGIGGATSSATVSYEASDPIVVTFVSATNRNIPAITDYVSIRVDRTHTFGSGQYSIEAYGVDGGLLAAVVVADADGVFPEIAAPGIHIVKLIGSGSTAFDDLVFDPLQNAQPRLSVGQSGENVILSWLAAFEAFQLETTFSLSDPQWQKVTNTIIARPDGRLAITIISTVPQQYFRLRLP